MGYGKGGKQKREDSKAKKKENMAPRTKDLPPLSFPPRMLNTRRNRRETLLGYFHVCPFVFSFLFSSSSLNSSQHVFSFPLAKSEISIMLLTFSTLLLGFFPSTISRQQGFLHVFLVGRVWSRALLSPVVSLYWKIVRTLQIIGHRLLLLLFRWGRSRDAGGSSFAYPYKRRQKSKILVSAGFYRLKQLHVQVRMELKN